MASFMDRLREAQAYFAKHPSLPSYATISFPNEGFTFNPADFRPGGQYYHLFNADPDPSGVSSGVGPGDGAAAAASAFQPTVSASHVGLMRGPAEQGEQIVERPGAFAGLNTAVPETALAPGETPWCKNVHGGKPLGSITFRKGCVKLKMDRDTVHDGTVEAARIQFVPKADYLAAAEGLLFTAPNGDTHAFWIDTTGADAEPAWAGAADNTTAVDISSATTAAQVAALFETAIDGAAIGLDANDALGGGVLDITTTTAPWYVDDYVADTDFEVTDFAISSGVALNAGYGGCSIEPLYGDVYDGDRGMLLTFQRTQAAYIGTTSTDLLCVAVVQKPLFGYQKSLENADVLSMTLADLGSGALRATVASERDEEFGEIVAITVRYSTRGFPLDVDGYDDNSMADNEIDPDAESSGFFANANRGVWLGASTNFQANGVDQGVTVYVTAWGHTREGTTKPIRRVITLA